MQIRIAIPAGARRLIPRRLPVHTLYLLRHAKAVPETAQLADRNRPLSRRGRLACALLAEQFRADRILPQLALCSPAARTRETLRRLTQALDCTLATRYPKQLYLAAADTWLHCLHQLDDEISSVLLVGHNPGLENLAHLLAGGGNGDALHRLAERFPTAALATFKFRRGHWKDLAPAGARLTGYVTPKDIEG